MQTLGVEVAGGGEPAGQPGQGEQRDDDQQFQLTDSTWMIYPIEYVPSGPPPQSSLLDETPERLRQLWDLTLSSLGTEKTDGEMRAILERAREYRESFAKTKTNGNHAAADPGGGSSPESTRHGALTAIAARLGNLVGLVFHGDGEQETHTRG